MTDDTLTASVVGGTGFTGGELLRLLDGHPNFQIEEATSRSTAGKSVGYKHPNLRHLDLRFTDPEELASVDVLFAATPHGVSMERIDAFQDAADTVVDLSADFRLPTEAEWELAAAGWSSGDPETKQTYPWGEEKPNHQRANLDLHFGGTVDVTAFPDGDSPFGCRQMIGNCWEWTSSRFEPFSGFEPDYYLQYSQPWFGSRRVLRGGSWMTRSRLIRNGYRNFFTPNRSDIPAGFRTCNRKSES